MLHNDWNDWSKWGFFPAPCVYRPFLSQDKYIIKRCSFSIHSCNISFLILNKGILDSNGRQRKDVDKEFVLLFTQFDENESYYLDENIQTYAGDPSAVDKGTCYAGPDSRTGPGPETLGAQNQKGFKQKEEKKGEKRKRKRKK